MEGEKMNWLHLLDGISDKYDKYIYDYYILHKLDDWLWFNDLYKRALGGWWPREGGTHPTQHMRVRPCTIQRKRDGVLPDGLLLIEHRSPGDNCDAKDPNRQTIQNAIEGVNDSLGGITGAKWGLSIEHHYRLSNRVAWAWRLARLGIPTILFYQGYEVSSHEEEKVVASDWWGRWLDIDNDRGETTPMLLLPRDYETCPAVIAARQPQDLN